MQLLEEQRNRELVNKNIETDIKSIQTAWEEKSKEARKKLIEKRIAAQPKDLQDDLRKLAATPPEQRNDIQKYLAQRFEFLLKVLDLRSSAAPEHGPARRTAGYRPDCNGPRDS